MLRLYNVEVPFLVHTFNIIYGFLTKKAGDKGLRLQLVGYMFYFWKSFCQFL